MDASSPPTPSSPITIRTFVTSASDLPGSSIARTETLYDHSPGPAPPPEPMVATVARPPKLTFSGIARLLVRVKRARQRLKSHPVVSSSGDAPITSATLGDGPSSTGAHVTRKVTLSTRATFLCLGGVDAPKLIRVTRETLLGQAQNLGANVLVDEKWVCTIYPKHKSDGTYRVYIDYDASAARCDVSDPHKPIALERAQGIPGLMTVLGRA